VREVGRRTLYWLFDLVVISEPRAPIDMPGKELSDLMDNLPTPQHALLKAHKALPRRPVPVEPAPPTLATHSQLRQLDSEQKVLGKIAQIESWIPEPEVIHLALDHSLPLTPPSNSPEDEGTSWIDGPLSDDHRVTTRSVSSGITTPLIQRSPPTPETTPPRADHLRRAQAHISNPPTQSIGTRTESFKTARENVSSEDGSDQSPSPSMQPSRQKWLRHTAHARLRDIGLGLGLELGNDPETPLEETPKASPKRGDFVTFDGAWGSDQEESATPRDTENLAVEAKTRSVKRPRISINPPDKPSKGHEDSIPLSKSLSLRQRLEKSRNSPTSASTESFAKHINWPLQDDEHLDLDVKVREFDNRRFSQMSGTSTIEAKVIDSVSPKRRQTLRRTGKFSRLDEASALSNRNSMLSNGEIARPRTLRHAQSPETIKRGSVVSDVGLKGAPQHTRRRKDSIPVIVIPER